MIATASTGQSPWHFDETIFQAPQTMVAGLAIKKIALPSEVLFIILSKLRGADLAVCCLVNKTWKQLASSDLLWREIVVREIAFGPEKWNEYFGDVGIAPPLPLNILEILKSPCPIWEGKKVSDTHMLVLLPKTVDSQLLTLNSLEKLVKSPKKGHATCYRNFWDGHRKEHGDTSIGASYWMLMTKDILPGSRNRFYSGQKALVESLTKKGQAIYEVPKLLEATCSIFTAYVASGKRLFSDDSSTHTSCQEMNNNIYQMLVGGFASTGLLVYGNCDHYDCDWLGVAGLRKFF